MPLELHFNSVVHVEISSGILYKKKIVDLTQAFAPSSTWGPQV